MKGGIITDGFFGFFLPEFQAPVNGSNARFLNSVQVREIFLRLTNAALSRFKWINLPETCNERALEITLYFYGFALFFFDETLGYAHTPCTLPGPFNIYYESIRRQAYSYQYRKDYDINNSVLIRGNKSMSPDYLITWTYAPKIADAIRSVDVHGQTLKSPFGIVCDEQNRKSAITAVNKIKDNEILVLGNKYGNKNAYEVLNFVQACWLPEMWNNVKNYLEQAYTALGIDSLYSSKKERLVAAESQGQRNPNRHIIESELDMRRKACEEINRMFGLDVEVELNEVESFVDENLYMEGLMLEGGENNVPNNGDQ